MKNALTAVRSALAVALIVALGGCGGMAEGYEITQDLDVLPLFLIFIIVVLFALKNGLSCLVGRCRE